MSNLYGTTQITSVDEMAQRDEIIECLLVDDVLQGSSEDIKKFCESAEAQADEECHDSAFAVSGSAHAEVGRRVRQFPEGQ